MNIVKHHKRKLRVLILILWSGIVIVGGILFKYDPHRTEKAVMSPATDIAPPPVPFGSIPSLPAMNPALTVEQNAWDRLGVLVASHPEPLVNEFLLRQVQEGKVFMELSRLPDGVGASFAYAPTIEELRASAGLPVNVPVLRFDPEDVLRLKTDRDILVYWLVIGHETTHYAQWFYTPNNQKEDWLVGGNGMEEADCERQWWHELDAYSRECRLADAWMLNGYMSYLCRDDGQVRPEDLVSVLVGSSPDKSVCYPVWQALGS